MLYEEQDSTVCYHEAPLFTKRLLLSACKLVLGSFFVAFFMPWLNSDIREMTRKWERDEERHTTKVPGQIQAGDVAVYGQCIISLDIRISPASVFNMGMLWIVGKSPKKVCRYAYNVFKKVFWKAINDFVEESVKADIGAMF